tara:strand:+ start:1740 stop:2111 length:372 start_codon:yes stop_codon:yes gene_type:complete
MKRRVMLDYSLGEGWLARWLDGLRDGKAVASTCATCDETQFPPLRVCPTCRQRSDGWRTLGGGATVQFRTNGSDGDIAMVRFDGASNACIARAEALPQGATRCALATSPDDRPFLALKAESET